LSREVRAVGRYQDLPEHLAIRVDQRHSAPLQGSKRRALKAA
jgi:hypothetical protein